MKNKSNFKKVLSLVLILVMALSTMMIMPLTASAEAGDGKTLETAYELYTAQDVVDYLGGGEEKTSKRYIKLMNDIDMSTLEGYTFNGNKYSGGVELYGQGHKISNLVISTTHATEIGMLRQVKTSLVVTDFTLENVTLDATTKRLAGAICGNANGCTVSITDCNVSGTITGTGADSTSTSTSAYTLAGFVGLLGGAKGTFTNCTNTATVTSGSYVKPCVGGIVGALDANDGEYAFYNCKNEGTVTQTAETLLNNTSAYVGDLYGFYKSTQHISTLDAVISIRMRLKNGFGFMAITEADGFYFSTDRATLISEENKVEGQVYNGSATDKYSAFTNVTAATLNQPIYFVAYKTVDNEVCYGEIREINLYDVATDLQDGYFGGDATTGTFVTDSATEKALYVELVGYYDVLQTYLNDEQ